MRVLNNASSTKVWRVPSAAPETLRSYMVRASTHNLRYRKPFVTENLWHVPTAFNELTLRKPANIPKKVEAQLFHQLALLMSQLERDSLLQ